MNLDFFINRNHIFNNSNIVSILAPQKLIFGDKGFFTLNKIYFELVYMRVLNNLFSRSYLKTNMSFFNPNYWLFISPNFLVTANSNNSSMGAGVGSFVSLNCIIYPGNFIINFSNYNEHYLSSACVYLMLKYPWKLNLMVNNQVDTV